MCIKYRLTVHPEDRAHVRRIVLSSNLFSAEEVDVAESLVSERLKHGEKSGYHFIFSDTCNTTVGYTCFGRIPGTASSFDLYWIAVQEELRGLGVGRELLARTEEQVIRMLGTRLYTETSSRPTYGSTRSFYEHNGFRLEAFLEDYYSPYDGKMIYTKQLK